MKMSAFSFMQNIADNKPETAASAPDGRRDEDVNGAVLEVREMSARRSNDPEGVLPAVDLLWGSTCSLPNTVVVQK